MQPSNVFISEGPIGVTAFADCPSGEVHGGLFQGIGMPVGVEAGRDAQLVAANHRKARKGME